MTTENEQEIFQKNFNEVEKISESVILFVRALGVTTELGMWSLGFAFMHVALSMKMPLPLLLDMVSATYNANTEHSIH